MTTKTCFSIGLLTVLVIVCLFGFAMAEELVKGWYDPVNDWFVFEWERPERGKITSIFDPSNKIEPVIKAKVVYDKNASDYVFHYEVSNMGGKQPIFTILIKYDSTTAELYDATIPNEDWSTDENLMEKAWDWAKTRGEILGISPGETVSGFSFRSKSIPAITNAVFYGYRRAEINFPGDFDIEEVDKAFDAIYIKFKEQYKDKFKDVVLKTLGPTAPPATLKPVEFLDGIIAMKHEAFAQGWIKSKGIEMSLDAKLDAARKKMQSGDMNTAVNILKAFVNEVEAIGCESHETCPKGKHLAPEAYALLKYNAQYLIDNMGK